MSEIVDLVVVRDTSVEHSQNEDALLSCHLLLVCNVFPHIGPASQAEVCSVTVTMGLTQGMQERCELSELHGFVP